MSLSKYDKKTLQITENQTLRCYSFRVDARTIQYIIFFLIRILIKKYIWYYCMVVFFHTRLLMKIVIDLSGICFPISFTHGEQLKALLLLSEKYRYEEREKILLNICFSTSS